MFSKNPWGLCNFRVHSKPQIFLYFSTTSDITLLYNLNCNHHFLSLSFQLTPFLLILSLPDSGQKVYFPSEIGGEGTLGGPVENRDWTSSPRPLGYDCPAGNLILPKWFKSVQSLSCVRLFETPWTAACQASLSITTCRSLPTPMSIESVIPSNHLILCHPLLLLP